MKKRAVLFVFLFLVLVLPGILAADLNVSDADDEASKVKKARDCLKDEIKNKGCDKLSSEEKIFALLTANECRSEVKADAKSSGCWPKSGCNIKTTAQAILALNGDDKAEDWLLSQSKNPADLVWYLQIESSEETTCEITYDGSSYTTTINEDKKISSPAGSCLPVDTSFGGYWLKVLCYDEEFEISCDKSFQTNLLFKKITSPTIHVSSDTKSAGANGKTFENVSSLCFEEGNSCVYEGSLWAALVLDKDYDVDSYKPYLATMVDESDNEKYLPEAFLYGLGDDSYRNDLLLKQKSNKWWLESGNKFYDTAVALLPFSDEPMEKTNAKDWLLEDAQESDGCWNHKNIRDTAFLLYSIWPEKVVSRGGGEDGCEDLGNYCLSTWGCSEAGGDELDYGGCSGVRVCCDKPKLVESCADQGGVICDPVQTECSGGRMEYAVSDSLDYGQQCCVGGTCKEPTEIPETSECDDMFGTCRTYCNSDEDETGYSCAYASDFCCVKKQKPGGGYTFIWILVILIILVIVGILFKDKLGRFWFRIKSKFGKSKPGRGPPTGPGGPFFTPPSSRMPIRRPPRRMLPPSHRRPPMRRPPARRPKGELDNVLKKLKDMGK